MDFAAENPHLMPGDDNSFETKKLDAIDRLEDIFPGIENPGYIDKNYGGFFIIWDRLFGTFCDERKDEKPIYTKVEFEYQ